MLSVRCPVCPVCLSVCDVRALWPNGWTDQDEMHAGRPRPWPHCVRWGPSSPSSKGAQPPIFGPYLLRPNGCVDQDVTWYGGRLRPRRLCVRWVPSQRGGASPKFSAQVYCGQTARWMKLLLGMVVGLSPDTFVLDWEFGTQPPSPKRGGAPFPIFVPFLLWPNGWMHQDAIWYGCIM